MPHKLKRLIRKSATHHFLKSNRITLRIMNRTKTIIIRYHEKPSAEIRRYMHTHNFKWSRKHRYWSSYLSRIRLQSVEKIICFTENKLNSNE